MRHYFMPALLALVILSGCKSAEEQAAEHLASARSFLEAGDTPRAMVELRNALHEDSRLVEARLLMGDLLYGRGRAAEAFGQYRLALEEAPGTQAALRPMALISLDAGAWEEAERYGMQALAQAPGDPDLRALAAAVAFRNGVREKDAQARGAALIRAQDLLAAHPGLLRARRVVLAGLLQDKKDAQALEVVDAGLASAPDDRDLHNIRLLLLGRLHDSTGTEAQIRRMITLFPTDETLGTLLVQFYLSEGRTASAADWLKGRIDPASDSADARMVYLRFLAELESAQAMRAALDAMLAEDPLPHDIAANAAEFRALKAGADFAGGDQAAGLARMEALVQEAVPSAQTDRLKMQLARMRMASADETGARALVAQVLAHDPAQVAAIKMRSTWLIAEDRTEEAVVALRGALADAPQDAQILTLLAQAYQREGRNSLMADMLARAVETSNQGEAESLQYARYLMGQQQTGPAETILVDALRRKPDSQPLLVLLGQLHLAMRDWGRMGQDIAALRARFPDTPAAQAAADELQARMLAGQGRSDQLGQFLDTLAGQAQGGLAPKIAVIRNMVRTGQLEQGYARALELASQERERPAKDGRDDHMAVPLVLLLAQMEAQLDQPQKARKRLESLVAARPQLAQGWYGLYALEAAREATDAGTGGKTGAAQVVLEKALQALPDDRRLNLIRAAGHERSGEIAQAIAVYERLYAQDSTDVIVANNLASLLGQRAEEDGQALERAWVVARRLSDARHPAFRDTYGWLSFLRGDTEAALGLLTEAARGLPDDPAVAYHLGRALAANARPGEAQAAYARARALLAAGAQAYPALPQDLDRAEAAL
ncbi:hypothetical protein ABEB22_21170 (plasmid) [Thioclava sp. 'Guangxiensis']|uniref:hypothetical protein n=1 Tax=Thioclava sp. 'Guangxiensis' TaxID=3149044 RepID=UPI0038781608